VIVAPPVAVETATGRTAALTTDQQARLKPSASPEPPAHPAHPAHPPLPLPLVDHRLVKALAIDGRASFTDLAAAAGTSASTAARRLDALRADGRVFFDVEMDDAAPGVTIKAVLWMSVAPAHFDNAAAELSRHPELAFVAATTGRTNLIAQVLSTDLASLHRYLITDLAQVPGITDLETAPILTTLKAAGAVRGTG
jgi:DNA-binding Lrp family transcriptional regulator